MHPAIAISLFHATSSSLSLCVCGVWQSLSVLIASVLFAFNLGVWHVLLPLVALVALVARIPLINYRTDSPDLAAASGFAVLLLRCLLCCCVAPAR